MAVDWLFLNTEKKRVEGWGVGGDYWFFDNIGSLTTIISSFVLLSNVFWNAVDRIIKSWIFFLKVKVSYCCNTRLLKLTEMCRPLGHDVFQS